MVHPLFGRKWKPHGDRRIPQHANFLACSARIPAIVWLMLWLRKLVRKRRIGALLAIWVAYALAIQTVMASVGFGMSAFPAAEPAGFVICSHTVTPASNPQKPNPTPQCPFCFVAAQCAGLIALPGKALALVAYSGVQIAAVPDRVRDTPFVHQFRHTIGVPRAPPCLSV